MEKLLKLELLKNTVKILNFPEVYLKGNFLETFWFFQSLLFSSKKYW